MPNEPTRRRTTGSHANAPSAWASISRMSRKPEAAARNPGTTNGPMIPTVPPGKVTIPSSSAVISKAFGRPGPGGGGVPTVLGAMTGLDDGAADGAGGGRPEPDAVGIGVATRGVDPGP